MTVILSIACSALLGIWANAELSFAWALGLPGALLFAWFWPSKFTLHPGLNRIVSFGSLAALLAYFLYAWVQRNQNPIPPTLRVFSFLPALFYARLFFACLERSNFSFSRAINPIQSPFAPSMAESYLGLTLFAVCVSANIDAQTQMFCAFFGTLAFLFNRRWLSGLSLKPFFIWTLLFAPGAWLSIQLSDLGARKVDEWMSSANLWKSTESRSDANSARTSIGRQGRMDLPNKLVYRIQWKEGPGKLLDGIYPLTNNGALWVARPYPRDERSMSFNNDAPLYPSENVFNLVDPSFFSKLPIAKKQPKDAVISMTLPRDKQSIALPMGTVALYGLPLNRLLKNAMGSVSSSGTPGFTKFHARYFDNYSRQPTPDEQDLHIPSLLQAPLRSVIEEAGLTSLPQGQMPTPAQARRAAEKLQAHFARHWEYTLELGGGSGYETRSLSAFLRRDRRGHCEYFASSAVLLLRMLGIPARYATGYLVHEYQPEEDSWWVRGSDAHAWTVFWDGEIWRELDTTPPALGQFKSTNFWEQAADFWQRLQYQLDLFDVGALASEMKTPAFLSERWFAVFCSLLFLGALIHFSLRRDFQTKKDVFGARFASLERACSLACKTRRRPRETFLDFVLRCQDSLPPALAEEVLACAKARNLSLFSMSELGPDDLRRLRSCFWRLGAFAGRRMLPF